MIIGICGGTGSGKTTVANRILESVSKDEVVFLQQDSYYRNLDELPHDIRNVVNFDHPDAIDNDLLVAHLRTLKAGRAVRVELGPDVNAGLQRLYDLVRGAVPVGAGVSGQ